MDILCDNQSAIALAQDHQFHPHTRHIDVRYHFIRWVIEKGMVRLVYCPTQDMVADVFSVHSDAALVRPRSSTLLYVSDCSRFEGECCDVRSIIMWSE